MQLSPSSSTSLPPPPPPPSSSPPPPPLPQQQQRPRSSSTSSPPATPSCTACAGVTVYSRALHDAGKPPSCLGISRTRKQPIDASDAETAEPTLLPPDVAHGGDFKFLCVGYAVCRDGANQKKKKSEDAEERKRGGASTSRNSNDDDDDVELPACLGIQIIRAAAATPAAMPMRGTATAGMANENSSSSDGKTPPPQQQPRRAPLARNAAANAPPSAAPELPSLLDALDKWEKSARRVAVRMGSNLVSIFGGRE